MQFPLVFFLATSLLLLLGILVRLNLWTRDPLFTAYLSWFLLQTAVGWLYAQTAWSSRNYELLFMLGYGVNLLLASAMVWQRGSWPSILFAGLVCAIGVWIGSIVHPRTVVFEFCQVLAHVIFCGCFLRAALQSRDSFESIQLWGLFFFWLGQAVASWLFIYGYTQHKQISQTVTNTAATIAILAALWMSVNFWFNGIDGARELHDDTPFPMATLQEGWAFSMPKEKR